ncbi:MAG: hypothetical protein M3Q44_03920 [bacterium]|nr:hypothetical protein [bacterium]
MEERTVNRNIFVKAQLMRIRIAIRGNEWELSGTPAENPQPGDEMVDNQYHLCLIYEEYGLYKTNLVDKVMGWVENQIGLFINSRRERTKWRRSGIFE